jgi:hypothetical protein
MDVPRLGRDRSCLSRRKQVARLGRSRSQMVQWIRQGNILNGLCHIHVYLLSKSRTFVSARKIKLVAHVQI